MTLGATVHVANITGIKMPVKLFYVLSWNVTKLIIIIVLSVFVLVYVHHIYI